MILFGDYHTHTKYSRHNHGKGTILENASVALTTSIMVCVEKILLMSKKIF